MRIFRPWRGIRPDLLNHSGVGSSTIHHLGSSSFIHRAIPGTDLGTKPRHRAHRRRHCPFIARRILLEGRFKAFFELPQRVKTNQGGGGGTDAITVSKRAGAGSRHQSLPTLIFHPRLARYPRIAPDRRPPAAVGLYILLVFSILTGGLAACGTTSVAGARPTLLGVLQPDKTGAGLTP